MKSYRYYIAVLACAVLALSGCNKEPGFTTGEAIRFGATTMAEPLTKTAYGDIKTETVSGEEKRTHQMIDWVEGDIIRITCAQASTVEEGTSTTADYKTSAGTKTGTESRANLSLASNNDKGLRWGSTEVAHTFYGVYPSPVTTGKSGDALTVDGALTGSIPESQTPSSVSSTTDFVASPDMTNQYMVAKRTEAAGKQSFEDGEVFLYFTPITTAIEFEVTNAMTEDLAISSIELISTNYNLSGTFTTSLTGLTETGASYSNYPTITASTGAKKNAAVSFGTPGLTLGANKKLTFTIFLLPESDLNDLTFRINKKGTNEYIQTKLARSETEYLTFTRCKKHFVKGLLAQDGAIWVDFSAKVQSWKTGVTENADVYDQNTYVFEINGSEALQYLRFQNGAEAESKNLQIASYSYNPSDPTNKTAVSFKATYSIDGGLNFRSFDAPSEDKAVNGLFGMKWSNNEGSTTSKTYPITAVARQLVNPGSHEYWANGSTNASWSPSDWTSKGTIYLPFYNPMADYVSRDNSSGSSANCYIIRHSGRYVLPLIYGNAMSDNYFKPKALNFYSKESNSLQKAVNYLGREITSPFIDKDDGVAVAGCKILWQDVAGVIKDLRYDDIEYLGPYASGDPTWNGYYFSEGTMAGLAFTVDPDKICQCNAVIGLVDADDNVIWSWHIWVTNDPAILKAPKSVYSSNEVEYKVFPMPALGTVSLSIYPARPDLILRLMQNDSGIERLVTIYQVDLRESQRATYYQFGRKDPFYAGVTPQEGDRLMTVSPSPAADITEGIKHPNVLYSGSNWLSDGHRFINLWSGAYAVSGSGVDQQLTMHKTIYDPSPAGYMVPALNAFSTLSSYIGDFNLGYFFKLTGDDLDGTYFGALGYLNNSGVLQESGTAGKYWSIIPDSLTSGSVLTIGSGAASPAALETGIPLGYGCLVRPVTDPNAKEIK